MKHNAHPHLGTTLNDISVGTVEVLGNGGGQAPWCSLYLGA